LNSTKEPEVSIETAPDTIMTPTPSTPAMEEPALADGAPLTEL
jgi:hypothetical protein